jgi:poly(3-hydroxybutyrate) depolymerase
VGLTWLHCSNFLDEATNRMSMIYQLHEMQHAVMSPWRRWAEMNQQIFGSPFSLLSYVPVSKKIAAACELMLRVTHRYEKPEFGLHETQVGDKKVAVTEEVADTLPFCRLLHFKRDTTREDPRVLVVAPLSGHYATLLRDTVRALLPNHDVYVTDWANAKAVPLSDGPFHFDDYVAYVQRFIRLLGPGLNVMSVCQPTVPVLAAISLMAQDQDPMTPVTMTMMGGPIDTRVNPTSVNDFATAHDIEWFRDNVISRVPARYPGFMREVYPGFLQHAGFVAMNPMRHVEAHRDFFYHLIQGDGEGAATHRRFYDEYNAVMDLPAEYYIETLQRVFKEYHLARGVMHVAGQLVEPQAIRNTALFTIEGELDDISGPGQTLAAHDLCSKLPARKKQHLLAPGLGHYGIFSGKRYRTMILPQIQEFIRAHA